MSLTHQDRQAIHFFSSIPFLYLPRDINCWVAGGAVERFYSGEVNLGDIDVWFPNLDEQQKAVRHLETEWNFAKVDEYLLNPIVDSFMLFDVKVQLNKNPAWFSKDMDELISRFDFTACMGAVSKTSVAFHPNFKRDVENKELKIVKMARPFSVLLRTQNYIKKGYTMDRGEFVQLAYALRDCDIEQHLSRLDYE